MDTKMSGSNYGYIEWRCGTKTIVEKNCDRNILLSYTNSTSVSPKFNSYMHVLLGESTKTIILKYDTGTTGNYIWDKYAVI